MKKRILVLIVGFLFIAINGLAADGDLIVNGNVGIGTTSPGAKFDVNGDIKVPMVDQWCTYGASPGNPTCTCPSGYYPIYCGTNHYSPMTLYITGTGCYAETGPGSFTDQNSAVVVRCAKIHQ